MFYAPILIKMNSKINTPVNFENGVTLRSITESEYIEYFSLNEVRFNNAGDVSSISPCQNPIQFSPINRFNRSFWDDVPNINPLRDDFFHLHIPNYMLEASDLNKLQDLVFYFHISTSYIYCPKIHKSSELYNTFCFPIFVHPYEPIYISSTNSLLSKNKFYKIFEFIKNDRIYSFLRDQFLYSIDPINNKEMRYFSLVSICESILLSHSGQSSSEKIRRQFANGMRNYLGCNNGESIYLKRSNIAHGRDEYEVKKLELDTLIMHTKKLLSLFLLNKC